MIPEFGLGNVLPPFVDDDAVGQQGRPRSPYRATMSEFVQRFASTPERAALLRNFKSYRDAIRDIGIIRGIQWIDGSFVEACEALKSRAPDDIDVVSAFHRPENQVERAAWQEFFQTHRPTLFDRQYCKNTYSCDAYYVDLDIPSQLIVEQTAYWFGVFSHQRVTFQWKGLVQLNLQCDDDEAMELLAEIEAGW